LFILNLDIVVIIVYAIVSYFHFPAQWNDEWMQFYAKERLLLNLYSKFYGSPLTRNIVPQPRYIRGIYFQVLGK
jgi:hypothetical protein